MKYTITINEEQRFVLIQALRALDATISVMEGEIMIDMLEALPQDEAEDPGCTHDFTA